MFFKKNTLEKQNNNLTEQDVSDEKTSATAFSYAKKAHKENNYQLAYEHLNSVAEDFHFGNRIRGKALYNIYLLLVDNNITLSNPFNKSKEDIQRDILKKAADFGYTEAKEELILLSNVFNPFFDK